VSGGHRDFLRLEEGAKLQISPPHSYTPLSLPQHFSCILSSHHFVVSCFGCYNTVTLTYLFYDNQHWHWPCVMAEHGARGQQPPKRNKPSRLRYEMQADSRDDQGVTAGNCVQVPDSQTVIPETQLDNGTYGQAHDKEFDRGEPLSPNSAAILDRTAAKKGTETIASSPITVTYLTKDSFSNPSGSAPLPTFSFSQAKRTVKVLPKVEATTSHPPASANPPGNEPDHLTDRTGKGGLLSLT
jgi:hypothetical protein